MQDRTPVTPAAWNKWLSYEKVSADRAHQHYMVAVPDPSQPLDSSSDKENQQPPVDAKTLHLLCLVCHGRFILTAKLDSEADSRSCAGTGYPTHHFHLLNDNTDKCCGCNMQLSWEFSTPVIPMDVIEGLSDTRKVNITYAAYTQQHQSSLAPTVASALATVLIYIRDMLTGIRRNISIEKPNFVERIGVDPASIQLFGVLGFQLDDDKILVPSLGTNPEDQLLLCTVRQEIEVTLASIRSPHGILSIPDQSIVPNFEPATQALLRLLGAEYEPKRVDSTTTASSIPEHDILGVVPDMADNVIIWAYKLLVNEQPQNHSRSLEALQKIAQTTKSNVLETEVAIEHSQGVYGVTDIARAYEYFGVVDSPNVDDDLILGLYDIKTSDEPSNMKEHIHNLRILANHRQSSRLLNMLSTIDDFGRVGKSNGDKTKSGATPTIPAPPTAEQAFSETKKVWQKATNILKSEVSHAKDLLMEYSSFTPSSSTPVNSIVGSGHHIFMPGHIGMFSLPPPMQQPMYIQQSTTETANPVQPNNDDTISRSSASTPIEKRSERSNSNASIASLAVSKYSSAMNALSNAVAPAAMAASNALATLSTTRSAMNSPVGLNNIGNTCYLNSLLQYYFTLKSLRDPVLDMDQYVENEEDPDWEEKRIGGIKVGRNEVKQAKQFVALLRQLFLNLMHTQEISIAPQESLAYMALTSAEEIANSAINVNLKQLSESEKATDVIHTKVKPDLEVVPEEEPAMTTDTNEEPDAPVAEGDPAMSEESATTEIDAMNIDAKEEEKSAPSTLPEQEVAQENISHQNDDDNVKEEEKASSSTLPEQNVAQDDVSHQIGYDYEQQSSQLRSSPSTDTLATTGSQATINETIDIPALPDRRPVPLPPPYTASDSKAKVTESTNPFEPSVRAQDPTKMLFGRQQDVTECMGNCMYFFEAALRSTAFPSSPDIKTDLVKELFYGKARQILSYNNQDTNELVTKVKEEEFSHLIVDAAEGKNLYDGLDEYFFADKVDDYQGGNCAVREVAVSQFPPILQIQVQRVQFDRSSARVYKSNAFVQFDNIIYLDRYLDSNFEALADRRKRVTASRKQLDTYKAEIAELTNNKKYAMPVAEMLEITTKILKDNQKNSKLTNEDYEQVMHLLLDEIQAVKSRISDRETKIESLIHEIRTKYDDLQECKYQLHAVFIHQGQANYGHYWIYIRDHVGNKWWKYNDINVSEVNEAEIFKDTTGSTANPYFLVYVKASDVQKHVMTVCRKKLSQ